ncbi:Putative protein [Zobellia galactanivorans]|uniref:Uncharacterized protein n=1 Tax=Zobellia galactanivorans (strain DSM 12802 / CCUG 47099 / CIP 106680 / NCIMB 13871 / Dsij) TaxID=63186 RepID=G0L4V3_ZOBGA|nr:Putative protein [Zobellia galactanivorans]
MDWFLSRNNTKKNIFFLVGRNSCHIFNLKNN